MTETLGAQALVARLRKMAVCVYLAAEKGPAADIADGLTKAADALEANEQRAQTVRELADTWRLFANDLLLNPEDGWQAQAAQLKTCASQLEAALSEPEPKP